MIPKGIEFVSGHGDDGQIMIWSKQQQHENGSNHCLMSNWIFASEGTDQRMRNGCLVVFSLESSSYVLMQKFGIKF